MAEPFWQRSFSSISYDMLQDFIEEGIPEGDHIEYKLPTYNKSNDKFEFTSEFLETIVAFANAGGGLVICGVDEDGAARPTTIEGIRVMSSQQSRPRDPAEVLRSTCATQIDPPVSLDTLVLDITDGRNVGNKVLLARVRRGLLPPYNLKLRRGQGIFIRNGDTDATASVREIAELMSRRDQAASSPYTLWAQAVNNTFTHLQQHVKEVAPFLMVGITPAFPISPVTIDHQTDRVFQSMCASLFGSANYLLMEPDGITFNIWAHNQSEPHPPYSCAYADGSIGIRDTLSWTSSWPEGRPKPLDLSLIWVWRKLREVLTVAQRWPREVCGYGGPLVCRIALGNLSGTVASVPHDWISRSRLIPPSSVASNTLPSWTSGDIEWDLGQDVDDLIERQLASLSRQLQFGFYNHFKDRLRAEAAS